MGLRGMSRVILSAILEQRSAFWNETENSLEIFAILEQPQRFYATDINFSALSHAAAVENF